jgi:5-methylcytosine-specific restriction protein B
MDNGSFDRRRFDEIKAAIDDGLASGKLLTKSQIDQLIEAFDERFGPAVLQTLNGEELLFLLHGRSKVEGGSLAYWLEFKNDEEFDTKRFGSISGGSALKFELYQRQSDGVWITGSSKNQSVMTV